MPLLVGVDDTDSRSGGCTTSLADALVRLFPELVPREPPRLVRLNPNVPWKTRGNAAIALAFEGSLSPEEVLARAWDFVRRNARPDPGTSPGVVVAEEAPSPRLYHDAVTRIVERDETEAALRAVGARWTGGRGVIGAAAALAWPAARTTWELIAYREPARIGTPRLVDDERVRAVEQAEPTIFDSYDLLEDETVCVPASPCPLLWGLRGTDPEALVRAGATLGPEPAARSTVFLTNQGSDDHLQDLAIAQLAPHLSARVQARVQDAPRERNGHVFLDVDDGGGRLRCAAYAPTRSFRHLVRRLAAGDEITVAGGLHEGPDGALTLGLEKFALHHGAPRKVANPACTCGRRMRSAGRAAGWRCRPCGTRAAEPETAPTDLAPGWHEVPACARRHLARPLKLGVDQPSWTLVSS